MDKILLVTGASSDIGCTLIENIVKEYKMIFAHYYNMNEKLQKLHLAYPNNIVLLQADFSDEQSIKSMLDLIKGYDCNVNQIIHLVGDKFENKKFIKTDLSTFKTNMEINFYSIVDILMLLLPDMSKQKYGRVIVMLTSYTINVPPKYLSSYVTSKYALLGLMKSLAAEYADKGITINGVSPEMIETKYLNDLPQLVKDMTAEKSPLGRILTVDDVIPTIKYLLQDESMAITGQNLAITGGQ